MMEKTSHNLKLHTTCLIQNKAVCFLMRLICWSTSTIEYGQPSKYMKEILSIVTKLSCVSAVQAFGQCSNTNWQEKLVWLMEKTYMKEISSIITKLLCVSTVQAFRQCSNANWQEKLVRLMEKTSHKLHATCLIQNKAPCFFMRPICWHCRIGSAVWIYEQMDCHHPE